jgi:hypothetical protein
MLLRDFTAPEIEFLDAVIGCMGDNEHDKPEDEAMEAEAGDINQHWFADRKLHLPSTAHWHLLECYVDCIAADELFDPEDLLPESCTPDRYWSEAAMGRIVRMLKAVRYRAVLTARRYFTVELEHGEQDGIVESS